VDRIRRERDKCDVMKPLLIFGAGGHGRAVIGAAIESGLKPDLISDDHSDAKSMLGFPLLSSDDVRSLGAFRFVVAIGTSSIRRAKFDWLVSLGGEPETIIHPRASVSPFACVGKGSVIFSLAHLDPCVEVGENCILNVAAHIGHDSIIEEDCHISANTVLGGGCIIKRGATINLGAIVNVGVTIGEYSELAMGALVSKDVPPHYRAISPHKKEAILLPIVA